MKKKYILIFAILLIVSIILAFYFLVYNSKENVQRRVLSELFEKIPERELKKINFDAKELNQSKFIEITKKSEIEALLQNDTLLKDYNFEADLLQLVGKQKIKNNTYVVLKREYGVWFVSFNILKYNEKYHLEKFENMVWFGGDEQEGITEKGVFINDSVFKVTSIEEIITFKDQQDTGTSVFTTTFKYKKIIFD